MIAHMDSNSTTNIRHTVRPLRHDDHAQWLPLWQGYLTFYKSQLSSAQTQCTWDRLNDPQFNLHGFVAEHGGQLVGITHFLFHPSSWTTEDYCYLQDLYVHEGQRGQGIARQLIEAVVKQAKRHPAQRVYWLTHESNANAQLLYDRVATATGFIQYRIAPL